MNLIRSAAVASALLVLAAGARAEDLTVVAKRTAMGQENTNTTYMTSEHFRSSGDQVDLIVDLNGKLTMIDHKKKEYSEVTQQELQDAMRAMAEQLKSMPPMMQKMMGDMAAQVSVKRTGASRTIAGYGCDTYTLTMGENMSMDLCVTKSIKVPTQFYNVRNALYAGNPMAQSMAKLIDEMKKLDGFPLAESMTWKMMGRDAGFTSEATEVKKGPIPASVFEVPAGYKKVESSIKKAAARRPS